MKKSCFKGLYILLVDIRNIYIIDYGGMVDM